MSDGIEDKGRCSGVLSGDAGEEYPRALAVRAVS